MSIISTKNRVDFIRRFSESFGEFISIFLPAKNTYYGENNSVYSILNRDYYMLQRVVLKLIEGEKTIERARLPLTSNNSFNSFEIFEMIKSRGMAYFTSIDVSA